MRNILWIFLLVILTGCSIQQKRFNELADQLPQQPPEKLVQVLKKSSPNKTDVAQYYLNLGYLELLAGQFESSIQSLTLAKNEMQLLAATSISENAAASTINETFRRYSGYPTDRVMVHNMLALSYLFNQNIEAARIEMLQADIAMKTVMKENSTIGQLASTHLLSAIIYELLDERSNAFISYQLAESILIERKMSIPNGIQHGLIRMSQQMGNPEKYHYYSQKYSLHRDDDKQQRKVFHLHFDGVVSSKIENSLMASGKHQLVRISMPAYPQPRHLIYPAYLMTQDQKIKSEVIENVEAIVREDLEQEYPSILLLTTTRAIAKYASVKAVDRHDPLLGAFFNLLTLWSEVADLRSWNMLPSTIQFSYLETKADTLFVSMKNDVQYPIFIGEGKQHVILSSSLSEDIFHYQQ